MAVTRYLAREIGEAIVNFLTVRASHPDQELSAAWEDPTAYEVACMRLAEAIDDVVRERLKRAA